MPRPIKDPKKKIETTVNQMMTKFSTLRRMADLGHLNGAYYEKVERALIEEMRLLDVAVEHYAQPELKPPFKLNGK